MTTDPDTARPPTPSPTHSDLYVLIVGIFVGVMLGPAVMGKLAPRVYESVFTGGRVEALALQKHQLETQSLQETLLGADPTGAGAELLVEREAESWPLRIALDEAKAERARLLAKVLLGTVGLLLACMVAEAVLDRPEAIARLRYVVAAALIAMLFAAPSLLRGFTN